MMPASDRGPAAQEVLRRNARSFASGRQNANGLLIEAHEGLAAEPLSIMGNDSVGEITAGVEESKARFNAGRIGSHIVAVRQCANSSRHFDGIEAVDPLKDPAEFAQRGHGDRDQRGMFQEPLGDRRLDDRGDCTGKMAGGFGPGVSGRSRSPSPRA